MADITAPILASISIVDPVVNMDGDDVSFTVRATITDDDSGLASGVGGLIQVEFISPSGQTVSGVFDIANPVAADTYDAVLSFGEFAEAGTWTVYRMFLYDNAGNGRELTRASSDELDGLGSVTVVNADEDVAAPTLVNAPTLSHVSIDVGAGETSVVVTAALSDVGSGLSGLCQIDFESPSGQTVTAIFDLGDPVSGDLNGGIFRGTLTFGQFAETGTWHASRMLIYDAAGQVTQLGADSPLLDSLSLEVTGTISDATPPQLASLNVGEPVLTANDTVDILVTARLVDDLSGLIDVTGIGGTPPQIQFRSANGQTSTGIFDIANPVSGDQNDGIFEATVSLSLLAEPGTWIIDRILLYDSAGNGDQLDPLNTPWLAETTFVIGSMGADAMGGSDGGEAMYGYGGDDVIAGEGGADTIEGGDGNDTVDGGTGDDTIIGGNGAGNDLYAGGSGSDTVIYRSADLKVVVDLKKGVASGADIGNDKLKQIEAVLGGKGGDKITGSNGADILDGNTGKDTLEGGKGKDAFVFSTELGTRNVDKILDFKRADDSFHVSADVFAGLSPGALAPSAFFKGAKAKDADDRLGYDKKKGVVLFDADGAGGAAAVVVAELNGKPSVGADDFIIA